MGDAFVAARRLATSLESEHERLSLERSEADALLAETQLREALATAVKESGLEAAKKQCPFRRRFSAAWCWAEVLHHAIMHAPAAGDNVDVRAARVRQLRLLLDSGLCPARRGRWYNELAKEIARAEGPRPALLVAVEGLAEGEPPPISSRIEVDLTVEASQDTGGAPSPPQLPRDSRWDLARRCRTLANQIGSATRGSRGSNAWQRQLRSTPGAQAKAAGGDDGGRWLPKLVERLIAEEASAPGPIQSICATTLGLPQTPAPGAGSGRRLFDGFYLEELTVEELALRHYLGGADGFEYGIHCEGALLRDLFGIILYDQLFDTSVQGVFVSQYQDAPLDLGTEAFYSSRSIALEQRLRDLASLDAYSLASEVRHKFAALCGTQLRGVRWDRYEGPNAVFRRSSTKGESCVAEATDN